MKWPWLLLSRRNSVLQQFFCTLIMRMPCSLFLTLRMCSLLLSSSVKNKKQLPTFFCFLPLLALIQTYSSQTYCFKELLKHKRVALGRCSHSFFSWEDFHMPRSIKNMQVNIYIRHSLEDHVCTQYFKTEIWFRKKTPCILENSTWN